MFKIDVIKAAAVVVLGEAFAHYEVLPNGALMFGEKGAYRKGRFLVVARNEAYFTNPFGDEADIDMTEEFYTIVGLLQEADKAGGFTSLKLLAEMAEQIGRMSFVGVENSLYEVLSTVYAENLLKRGFSYHAVHELMDDCRAIGEDSYIMPSAWVEEQIEQAMYACYHGSVIDAAFTRGIDFDGDMAPVL